MILIDLGQVVPGRTHLCLGAILVLPSHLKRAELCDVRAYLKFLPCISCCLGNPWGEYCLIIKFSTQDKHISIQNKVIILKKKKKLKKKKNLKKNCCFKKFESFIFPCQICKCPLPTPWLESHPLYTNPPHFLH